MSDAGEALLARMQELRVAVGRPSLTELEALAAQQGATLPPQTLSPILRGERLPRWQTVEAYIAACKLKMAKSRAQPEDLTLLDQSHWLKLWEACQQPGTGRSRHSTSSGHPIEMHDCEGIINGDHATMSITINR